MGFETKWPISQRLLGLNPIEVLCKAFSICVNTN